VVFEKAGSAPIGRASARAHGEPSYYVRKRVRPINIYVILIVNPILAKRTQVCMRRQSYRPSILDMGRSRIPASTVRASDRDGHQLPRVVEAREVTHFRDDDDSCHEGDTAHRPERLDDGRHRPIWTPAPRSASSSQRSTLQRYARSGRSPAISPASSLFISPLRGSATRSEIEQGFPSQR
jgi:hypothetical protein